MSRLVGNVGDEIRSFLTNVQGHDFIGGHTRESEVEIAVIDTFTGQIWEVTVKEGHPDNYAPREEN